ncbi:MAG TPA: hypothetical protein PKL52_09065 [Tenuifilaceae bacterium]|nr:hypothetical protein [Tenuifilaceae bacterium]
MKTRLILLLLVIPTLAFSQTWDYPVKPESNDWNLLKSNKAKVEACQIPESVLFGIKTKELFNICFQYPLLNDIYAFNDLSIGINKLFKDFNGIRELFGRSNISQLLLEEYRSKLRQQEFLESEVSDIIKGEFIVSISTIELFLGLYEMRNEVDNQIKKEVVEILLEGYELKKRNPNYYMGIGFVTNIYSRYLIISKVQERTLDDIGQCGTYGVNEIDKIDEESFKYINRIKQ